MTDSPSFDVIIIGGSYAGLSAAMSLGRSMKKVLILDEGRPCNRQTPHSHNLITQDGEKPSIIAEQAKNQVLAYPTVKFHNGLAINAKANKNDFTIITEKGEAFNGKKLIFATGIKDLMPDIKGFADCWGISVVHCPYCHGYEYRNKKTALLLNGDKALHVASLVSNLTNTITVLTNGKAIFSNEQALKLKKHNISVIEEEIAEIEHVNGYLKNIIFKNGSKMAFEVAYASVPFKQHTGILDTLKCEMTEQGYVKVDSFQKTSIKGVFACGDNSSMMRSVANAIATGSFAGAMVNKELTEEEF